MKKLEIERQSVSTILKELFQSYNNSSESSEEQLYFRGESDQFDYRTPSLYLVDSLIEGGSEYYYRTLLNELGRVDYQESASMVRLISELQHYGAKTRMLDVTKSILIALFFAVEHDNKKPGFVYIYKAKIGKEKFDTGHTVAIKSALNFMPQKSINDFLDINDEIINKIKDIEKYKNYTGEELFKELRALSDTGEIDEKLQIEYEKKCKLFMELLNQRAKVREKLVYPLKIYDDLNSAHLILPAKATERIRQQQGAFIFPKYVSSSRKKGDDIKIEISKSIDELQATLTSSKKGKNQKEVEYSIIKIPEYRKEKIRRELSQIGITSGFVYPDIEHQSKAVIDRLKKVN